MEPAQTCEVSASDRQKLMWGIVEVKRSNSTYRFEIHKVIDGITVYFYQ